MSRRIRSCVRSCAVGEGRFPDINEVGLARWVARSFHWRPEFFAQSRFFILIRANVLIEVAYRSLVRAVCRAPRDRLDYKVGFKHPERPAKPQQPLHSFQVTDSYSTARKYGTQEPQVIASCPGRS